MKPPQAQRSRLSPGVPRHRQPSQHAPAISMTHTPTVMAWKAVKTSNVVQNLAAVASIAM
jgi:hypothetical protein